MLSDVSGDGKGAEGEALASKLEVFNIEDIPWILNLHLLSSENGTHTANFLIL